MLCKGESPPLCGASDFYQLKYCSYQYYIYKLPILIKLMQLVTKTKLLLNNKRMKHIYDIFIDEQTKPDIG